MVFRCTSAACSKVQGEHGYLLVLAIGPGEFALLGVMQGGVGAVPVLDDLEALVDLPAQLFGDPYQGSRR
jgi:hypothetical protein